MLRQIIRRATRNALFLGVMLGAVISSTIPTRMASAAVSTAEPPICENLEAIPDAMRDFASLQCGIESAVFSDQLAPTIGYRMAIPATKPGKYSVTDAYGRQLSLEVVDVGTLPLRKVHPQQFTEDDEGYFYIGWLKGPMGKVGVSAVCLKAQSVTGDSDAGLLIVCQTLPSAEIDRASQVQRIMAGARVVDVATGHSLPLSEAPANELLSASTTDLSTLFGATTGPGGGGPSVDCVELAYKRFAIAQEAAARQANACIEIQVAVFAACVAACLIGSAFGLIVGLAAFAICAGVCASYLAVQSAGCVRAYSIQQWQNLENLKLDLAACGVDIIVADTH